MQYDNKEVCQVSTQHMMLSPGRANLALATLFLGLFVLGSGELLVVGVLDRIAADFHVTIPASGTAVTAYALGLAIGGPVLTALTIKRDKRTVLIGAFAGGIAVDNHSLSATVITGLLLAGLTIAVAWATSFLKPPAMQRSSPAAAQVQAAPEPA